MSAAHSLAPWRLVPDAYAGEDHYMVVDANDAPLFDSVNRSTAADNLTEQNDLLLAASAPALLEALGHIKSLASIVCVDDISRREKLASIQLIAIDAIAKATGAA